MSTSSTGDAIVNPRRCLMFVPGSRPERYAKAIATGADQVCIDLEDAVAPADKDSARASVFAFLSDTPDSYSEIGLRLNPLSTELGRKDLAELQASGLAPAFVMLPKVETVQELLDADAVLAGTDTGLIAQIETPLGLLDARAIARATPRRSRMPTRARLRLLYLDTPAVRCRWLTGTLMVFQPARCISAGR